MGEQLNPFVTMGDRSHTPHAIDRFYPKFSRRIPANQAVAMTQIRCNR